MTPQQTSSYGDYILVRFTSDSSFKYSGYYGLDTGAVPENVERRCWGGARSMTGELGNS